MVADVRGVVRPVSAAAAARLVLSTRRDLLERVVLVWLLVDAEGWPSAGRVRRTRPVARRFMFWLQAVAAAVADLAAVDANRSRLAVKVVCAHKGIVGLALSDRAAALGLPLLDLAGDVARSVPGGLAVDVTVLAGWAAGMCDVRSSPWRIWLAPGAGGDEFAHELAHACDPDIGTVGLIEAERFADRLGPLLLAHRPATLVEAAPLIDVALDARRDVAGCDVDMVAGVAWFVRSWPWPT